MPPTKYDLELAALKADQAAIDEGARRHYKALGLVTIKEAAVMLGHSVRSLRRWQAANLMPERIKHGHRMKYRLADIQAIIAKRDAAAG